jgi:cytoskeletal protein CcmA (bactofilin family)
MVEVRGRVTGSIAARQVKLLPSAKVEGDITYEQLSIDNGAHFEGRCIKSKGDSGNPDIKGIAGTPDKAGNGAAA